MAETSTCSQFKKFAPVTATNGYFVVRVERGAFNSGPAFSAAL